MNDLNKQIIKALGNWIIRVTDDKSIATPEEVAALPKVAEVFFSNYLSFSPIRNE